MPSIEELKEVISEMRDALLANGVFHTPVMRHKLGRDWNEFEIDAIQRTKAAIAASTKFI